MYLSNSVAHRFFPFLNLLILLYSGAGKTTMINIITGALAPTEGHVQVAGKDIRSQRSAIRSNLGICPQHDCLFDVLTVREHMQFYARLKGLYGEMSWEDAEHSVDQSLHDVALFEKRSTLSRNLSGGMKRKLSVAIAFCGGSKVVLLDEPTSGMVSLLCLYFIFALLPTSYTLLRCLGMLTRTLSRVDLPGTLSADTGNIVALS
jgi:ABC-type Na+ transport system ATPase subunit NatA